MKLEINFFAHDINFTPPYPSELTSWIAHIVDLYHSKITAVNFIFCSDEYLLELNRRYLSHDYLTDILTFPYEEEKYGRMADIYISLDRVRENASTYQVEWEEELHRVMIHGVLHLTGFDDQTESQQNEMRSKEQEALEARKLFWG